MSLRNIGEGPWLSTDNVCDYVETFLANQRSCDRCVPRDIKSFIAKTKRKDGVKGEARKIEEYEGTYGDYAYGNVTISVDLSTRGLIMEYGVDKWT